MDEAEIQRSARFLIDRHGVAEAKERAAQRALEVADPKERAAWLRVLQAVIDFKPSPKADTPLN